MAQEKEITRNFFTNDTKTVAKDLLGCLLIYNSSKGLVGGYIVETEAYLGHNDPACHSCRGRTKRNEVMFLGPGLVYVYLIYGLYYCLNFTTDLKDKPEAVLIRALEPVTGIEIMQHNRNRMELKELCSGPGKLAQALGIDMELNGTRIGDKITIYMRTNELKNHIVATTRIGISQAADLPLRFYIRNNQFISKK
ncbi:DNA-3-methyladenine glycosylase [Desulfitibacter alkalitolerans]|uniref:DNA-3-methyladenine glycosylase n=1 Tax=Desulfitibacter alkalitolerans TaxID=264641 RepID=UPI00047FF10F|nr:DNA-3-methyladenine glycosylase [Desulfitibacter alkalitolerans]